MARSLYLCPSTRSLAVRSRSLVVGTEFSEPTCLCSPPPTGPCCLPNDLCSVMTEAQCAGSGGVYRGDGLTCGDVTCAGACCEQAGCSIRGWNTCATAGGAFQGFGSTCSPDPCPQYGACCNSGTCTQTLAGDCAGIWLQGQPCTPNPCPPACCVAGVCCYRPTINVPVVATLTTNFSITYKQCCVNAFRACPTFTPTIQAQQNITASPNQCVSIPDMNLTTIANGPMPCPGTNCQNPWSGWSASLNVNGISCPGGIPTIQRRLRANTDPVASTNLAFGCSSWNGGGTHVQSQPEFCGGGQTLQQFGYSATLTLSNLLPCSPAAFRLADFRTTAGGLLVPDKRHIPTVGMRFNLTGDSGLMLVTPPGCSTCGSSPLTGGALI